MTAVLTITNETGQRLPPGARRVMQAAARAAIETACYLQPDRVRVDLTIVSDERLRELSRQYLGADHYTDVMAFSMVEGIVDGLEPPRGGGPRRQLLGDVVISRDRAAAQAQSLGHPVAAEMALLVVHGVLHLLAHDDTEPAGRAEMRRLERVALTAAGVEVHGPGEGPEDDTTGD